VQKDPDVEHVMIDATIVREPMSAVQAYRKIVTQERRWARGRVVLERKSMLWLMC